MNITINKILAAGVFSGVLALGEVLVGVQVAHAQEIVRLGTATVNDVQTEAIKRYGELIEKESGGRLKVELYPAGQLGGNTRMVESLQTGTLQVWAGPPAYLFGVDKRFQVLDAPGVLTDFDQAEKTLSDPEFRDTFLALGTKRGVRGVGLFIYSLISFNTKAPVRRIDDFKGKKIRVLNTKMERAETDVLGAAGIPMDISEIVSAMQQGTIDGIRSGLSIFSTLQLVDTAKYVTRTHEAMISNVLAVSERWFQKQPKDIQEMLVRVGRQLEPELNAYTRNVQEKESAAWTSRGGELIDLPAEDQAVLLKRVRTAADGVFKENPDQLKVYELLTRVADKYKQ